MSFPSDIKTKQRTQKISLHLMGLFIVFAIIAIIAGSLYFYREKELLLEQRKEALAAVADLKVNGILQWRNERRADAQRIFDNPLLAAELGKRLNGVMSASDDRLLRSWAEAQRKVVEYSRIVLLDGRGNVLISTSEKDSGIDTDMRPSIDLALSEKRIVFSDFYKNDANGKISISVVVPILYGDSPDPKLAGAILMDLDLNYFLFPFIDSWPIPSRTAETLLVRKEGNYVLFLNELRHKKGTALELRRPLDELSLPAARAAMGLEGVMEGKDYRGVPVLAVTRSIPDSPWYLVSKMDMGEVSAPIMEKADFCIVGDLFQVAPILKDELAKALKK